MKKPLRVVVLEDNPIDADLIVHELRRAGFDPQWTRVETEAALLAALDAAPQVILADYSLPHFDGLSALKLVRSRSQDIPFILVSATMGEDAAVEMMKQGAADYLLKDRITRLGPAVQRALDDAKLRREQEMEERYREMGRRVLQTLNEPGKLQSALPRLVSTIKEMGRFDAVGIRLKDGEDFPYAAQEGFGVAHPSIDESLIWREPDGLPTGTRRARRAWECACGLVISGRTRLLPSQATPGGSFWTNNSHALLDLSPEDSARIRPRTRCVQQGYASIALMPLRNEERAVGLLQCNSREAGFFTPRTLEFLEGIALHIGTAIIRERSHAALRALLAEKEGLLREVHHRVKNNLQVINSLLRLEVRHTADPDTRSVLGDMQGRIRSMALLHETLYRAGTFASVDLGAYLRQLATQSFLALAPKPASIALNLDLNSVRVPLDHAIPCGLLVNELLSNTFKHGFPGNRKGAVRVTLMAREEEHTWAIGVSDDGVGLPADFDERRSLSLGLQLVWDLARQIGGTVDVRSVLGEGATFTVTFRVDDPNLDPRP